jgi:hypothetical protein
VCVGRESENEREKERAREREVLVCPWRFIDKARRRGRL